MSGDWTRQDDAATCLSNHQRRGKTSGANHGIGHPVWRLWISPDNVAAAVGGVESKPQAGGADLEKGGIESASEAASTKTSMVE